MYWFRETGSLGDNPIVKRVSVRMMSSRQMPVRLVCDYRYVHVLFVEECRVAVVTRLWTDRIPDTYTLEKEFNVAVVLNKLKKTRFFHEERLLIKSEPENNTRLKFTGTMIIDEYKITRSPLDTRSSSLILTEKKKNLPII